MNDPTDYEQDVGPWDDRDDLASAPELGPCCACRKTENVRTILMLSKKCLIPGHGWGCFTCGLPSDGASVVLCDDCASCLAAGAALEVLVSDACNGYPATDGRCPLKELTEPFEHDMSKHPGER
jgi:hypothetical protein